MFPGSRTVPTLNPKPLTLNPTSILGGLVLGKSVLRTPAPCGSPKAECRNPEFQAPTRLSPTPQAGFGFREFRVLGLKV